MCFKKFLLPLAFLSLVLSLPTQCLAMGGKPQEKCGPTTADIDKAPSSPLTLKELAHIYWPDSQATQLQQEETLKNLLGKKVSWEVTVAQIQRDGSGYLIQGQSNKEMLGTFSYVQPRNPSEEEQILKASMGSTLKIVGVVSDMDMRHIILKPAFVQTGNE